MKLTLELHNKLLIMLMLNKKLVLITSIFITKISKIQNDGNLTLNCLKKNDTLSNVLQLSNLVNPNFYKLHSQAHPYNNLKPLFLPIKSS